MVEILDCFNKKEFVKRGQNFISELRPKLDKSLQIIECLYSKLDSDEEPTFSQDRIEEIRRKIRKYIPKDYRTDSTDSSDPFSIRDRKIICYFANEVICENIDYNKISFIIRDGWMDCFFKPLMRLIFNKWNSIENVMPIYELFSEKLKGFQGSYNRYLEWKEKIHFFQLKRNGMLEDGATLLSEELHRKNTPLLEFRSTFDVPKNLFHSEYFQAVIIAFYAKCDEIPENLETVLDEHENSDTSLIILSQFINRVEEQKLSRTKLQSLALRKIGLPYEVGKWVLFKPNEKFQNSIDQARKTVNNWLVQDYINEIFQRLIVDPDRKKFWSKYSKKISDVRIIGPLRGKEILSQISTLKDSLDYCYKCIGTVVDTYAFIMSIESYKFVEFSKIGNALYIYHEGMIDRLLEANFNLNSVNDLKRPSLPLLSMSSNKSCRMIHKNNWEYNLKEWILWYVEGKKEETDYWEKLEELRTLREKWRETLYVE